MARYFYEPLQYFDEEQRRVVIQIVHEKVKLILAQPPSQRPAERDHAPQPAPFGPYWNTGTAYRPSLKAGESIRQPCCKKLKQKQCPTGSYSGTTIVFDTFWRPA